MVSAERGGPGSVAAPLDPNHDVISGVSWTTGAGEDRRTRTRPLPLEISQGPLPLPSGIIDM